LINELISSSARAITYLCKVFVDSCAFWSIIHGAKIRHASNGGENPTFAAPYLRAEDLRHQ
jgi:hypothetical protein